MFSGGGCIIYYKDNVPNFVVVVAKLYSFGFWRDLYTATATNILIIPNFVVTEKLYCFGLKVIK